MQWFGVVVCFVFYVDGNLVLSLMPVALVQYAAYCVLLALFFFFNGETFSESMKIMSLRLHLISPETFVTLYQNYEA